MRFRILGPLEVTGTGSRSTTVTAARQRIVLSTLLLEANRVVSTDRLADALWDHSPPTTARGQVQICVWALRKAFNEIGLTDRIVTRPPGYLVRVEDGDLDLDVFDRLARAGQQALAESRLADAAEAMGAALALWRGSALAGLDSRVLEAAAGRLLERRLTTVEDRIDIALRLGQHHQVVGELRELVAAYPLRERLRAQQMKALFGAGRQAEALEAYRSARQTFVDELGLEPGTELRRLEREILTGRAGPEPAVPRLLPARSPDLAGRTEAGAGIRTALTGAGPVAPLVAISGRAGVGKSALAVHAAHDLAAEYSDGQLYLDLRGSTDRPVPPEQALARFLRALGLAGDELPDGLDERAERYRDLVAGRRVLVVLDDVADEAQAVPLLPGSASTGVIVTSRPRLTGLAGTHRVHLDPLDSDESVALLAAVAGADRLAAEPAATSELAGLCDGLPLALRIAAARLAARPHWTVARLVERLRDEEHRLDELVSGGQDVRAALATSYQRLCPAARRLFVALGRRPGPTGAVIDPLPTGAAEPLEDLVDAQLVEVSGHNGHSAYRLPGLVAAYARELAAASGEAVGALDASTAAARTSVASSRGSGATGLSAGAMTDNSVHASTTQSVPSGHGRDRSRSVRRARNRSTGPPRLTSAIKPSSSACADGDGYPAVVPRESRAS